VVRHNL